MKKLKKLFKFGLICFLIIFICYCSLYLVAKVMPKLELPKSNGYVFYDRDNKIITTNKDEWINLDDINDNLINATISIEDKDFYNHQGFDYLRILKAMYINIINGEKLQGASTITQQYAKNLYLDFDKTWKRKIEEAWLTIQIESHYDKDDILEGYLNTINYGGVFGIENASNYYFGKSASDLTLAEASMLAGIPKSPSNYSPLVNNEAAKNRQLLILKAMVKNDYITESEMNEAYNTELVYKSTEDDESLKTLMYYQDAVIDELESIPTIPVSLLKTGGLKITTNLDLKAQIALETSMNNNITNEEIQLASIAMNPNTGEVLGLIGGRDYSKSQYNRAISAKRQVGSTMKPFLYYAALENGFTPTTTFTSEKTTFTFSENKTYSPQNYGNEYPNKPITMAAAVAYSDNIYAVKTHLFLGEETLVDIAKRVGIKSELEAIPSLALGSEEISLIEMVKAYATFANEGYKIDPYFIKKVEDMNGNILYEYDGAKENVLNRSLVFVLNETLTGTYDTQLIDYQYPTCYNISYKMKHKYAVKTGTTDTDHLIFGYNPDFIIGAWTGYDDNKETIPTDGAAIKNFWVDAMENYLDGTENKWYSIPKNVVGVLVEPVSGEIATNESKHKKIYYYIKGTEPSYSSNSLDDSIPTIKEEEEEKTPS